MIIDAHTHIGKKTVIGSAADLVASMDLAGIDKALVLAGKMNDQSTENLLNDIDAYKDRLIGIGSVSPFFLTRADEKEAVSYFDNLLKNDIIKGIKLYVGYEHFYPQDKCVRPFLELLVKYNKPAIFHSGDCFNGACGAKLKYAHPLNFDELAVDMPELKIVIAHMGYPWMRDAAEVVYKNKNVYADTSGFVYGRFKSKDFNNFIKAVEEFVNFSGGTEKLIFGTDWPISDQKSYIEVMKGLLKTHFMLPQAEIDEIMGLRAMKLFGL